MLQTTDEIHTFTTSEADRLPLLHLILKESFEQPTEKLLAFLHGIPFLNDVCTKENSRGLKAGELYPDQAIKILCAACKNDCYSNIVNAFLEAGTNVDGCDTDLMTPLHCAAMYGNIGVMNTLLEHNASVQQLNIRQESCLLVACKNSQREAACLLFDCGADAFCSDVNQCNPISIGVSSHAVDMLQYMAAENPAVLDELQQKVSLADAVVFQYDILLSKYNMQNLEEKEMTEIAKLACTYGKVEVVQQFSKKLSDQDLLLHIEQAYKADQFECVNELLVQCKTRPGIPCPQISLTESVISAQLFDLTRLLIEHGNNPNENGGQPLRTAVLNNNGKAVSYLIEQGADVDYSGKKNSIDEDLLQEMFDRAEFNVNRMKGINDRLKYDTDVDYHDDDNDDDDDEKNVTPLMYACIANNLDMVDLLLQRGADINCRGNDSPLTITCQNDNLKILKRLLSNYPAPDLSIKSKDGVAPLEIAKGPCFSEIVLHLINKGSESFKHVSFNQVCQVGRQDLVESFLQNCSACQTVERDSLDFVVSINNLSLMRVIFSSDKVTKSSSVLMDAFTTACTIGSSKMVRLFIDYDSGIIKKCIDEDGNSNLHKAIRRHRPDIVGILIKNGYRPTQEPLPLQEAARSEQVLQLLLQSGLSQASMNDALMCVCRGGYNNAESCARLLLDNAAKVNYCDMNDQDRLTPLLAATLKSSTTLVKLLLSRGANPNIADGNHRTALYVACMLEHHELASMLLYNKGAGGRADPNLSSPPSDKNPLFVSCVRGYLDLVLLILNFNKEDGYTCSENSNHLVQAAHDAGQHEVVRLLLEFGSDPTLHSVSLLQACQLGYLEYALSLYHKASTEELCLGISEACKKGFEETALAIIIGITHQTVKRQCIDIWKQCSGKQPRSHSSQPPGIQTMQKNPLWECIERRDMETLKRLINEGHDPNIQTSTGKTLLQDCAHRNLISAVETLCNCPLIDINQKDSTGKNVLFYCLDCPLQDIEGRKVSMFDYLVEKGAEINPDNFQRTLLHELFPVHEGCAQGLLMEKFKTLFSLECQDCKGQTPLHIAILKQKEFKVRKLLEAGSNPHAKDGNDLSPFMLAERDPYMCKVLHEYHPDQSKTVNDPKMLDDMQSVHFSKKYSIDHRVTHSLYTLFKQRYSSTSEDLFRANFETPIQISTDPSFKQEFKVFCKSVLEFMKDMGREIKHDDPLFHFIPTLSGSCSEATKVIKMDEADVLCRFQHPAWKNLRLTNHEKDNFTYMKLESEVFAGAQPSLFNQTQLSAHGVFKRFYGLVRKHIAGVLKRHKNFYIVDVHDILPQECTICHLDLVWSGEVLPWQEFSVDVVPAIPVETAQLPGKLKHHDRVHDLVVVPKWTAGLITKHYANEAFQLGFSATEKDMFYAMPIALRQGYKLAKVMVHKCLLIDGIAAGDSISSYMLKCQAFEYFKSMPDFLKKLEASIARDLIDDELQNPEEIVKCADEIFNRLEQCIILPPPRIILLTWQQLVRSSNIQRGVQTIVAC